MYGRWLAGTRVTIATHQPELTTRTAAAASSSPTRRGHVRGPSSRYVSTIAGRTMYAWRYFVRKARPSTAAASSSHRVWRVWSDRTSSQALATTRKVSSASGLLNRNIRTATGVSAITMAATSPATAPAVRRTTSATSATLATPSSASGSSMLQELKPKTRPESAMSQSAAGGLSTVMKLAASKAPKKNAFQLFVPAMTAAA